MLNLNEAHRKPGDRRHIAYPFVSHCGIMQAVEYLQDYNSIGLSTFGNGEPLWISITI